MTTENTWVLDAHAGEPDHRHHTTTEIVHCIYPAATITGSGRWAAIREDQIVLHRTRRLAEQDLGDDRAGDLAEVVPWANGLCINPSQSDAYVIRAR